MVLSRVLHILVFSFLFFGCFATFRRREDGFKRLFKRVAASAPKKDLCENPIDLLFILDSSESVGAANWEKILNFTRKVASKFDVKYTRFGVIQFHSTPEVPIVLSSFLDNTTLDNALGSIYFKPGSTRTDLAITKAAEVFNKAPLRKASRVAIFVIGGRSSDLFVSQGKSINATDLIKNPAAQLQASHVAVYAASVAEGLPSGESTTFKAELNVLASNPPLDHIFESATYGDLLSSKPNEVAKKTCIVNGGMSAWSAWSTCSVTCGTGTRVRMRTCNNPKPENGGLPCTESTVETGECSVQPCPGNQPSNQPQIGLSMNNTNASNPGAENKTTSSSSSSSNTTLPLSPNNTSTNQLQSSNSTAPLSSSTPTENSTNVKPSANASSSPSLPPSLTSSLSKSNATLPSEPSWSNATMIQIPLPTNNSQSTLVANNTIPMLPKSNSKSNATLPSELSWSNATMIQIPLPTNNSQSTLVANNTIPMLPKYNLTSVINKPIQNLNNNHPGGSNPAVAKPGTESPWPPAPAGCQPNRPTVYGYPDLQICGNGFELITLSAHQLTASSTYSKDTGDKIIQYRHAPYNGLLNNTQNAGAWCAEHQFAVSQDENQYLSIDLGTPNLIGKIATQGMEHWDNWVSTYALKLSIDNINWETYPRTLQGNCDRRSITENILNPPFRARFVRVNPTSWYTAFDPSQHDICMRIGIYRCRDCRLVPLSRCNIEFPVKKTEGSILKQVTKKAQN